MDISEAGERAIGGQVVGRDDHPGGVFDGKDGGACYDGLLGVLIGHGLLCAAMAVREVGGVVAAVYIISRLVWMSARACKYWMVVRFMV